MEANHEIPERMKAWQWHAYGLPKDVLRVEEIEVPEPKSTQVLIKVTYAGINPVDWVRMHGNSTTMKWMDTSFPRGIGTDLTGTVVKIGKKVKNFKVGDHVIAKPMYLQRYGTVAEYDVAEEAMVAPRPEEYPEDEAAASPSVTMAAIQALRDYGKIKPGATIFINGGATATGQAAIQVAKNHFSSSFIATSCATRDVRYLESLGADQVFEYRGIDLIEQIRNANYGKIFDIYFDCVGGGWEMSKEILKKGGDGIFVTVQPKSFSMIKMGFRKFSHNVKSTFGSHPWRRVLLKDNHEDVQLVSHLLHVKKVRTRIHKVYDFDDLIKAIDDSHSGFCDGKAVVQINP